MLSNRYRASAERTRISLPVSRYYSLVATAERRRVIVSPSPEIDSLRHSVNGVVTVDAIRLQYLFCSTLPRLSLCDRSDLVKQLRVASRRRPRSLNPSVGGSPSLQRAVVQYMQVAGTSLQCTRKCHASLHFVIDEDRAQLLERLELAVLSSREGPGHSLFSHHFVLFSRNLSWISPHL